MSDLIFDHNPIEDEKLKNALCNRGLHWGETPFTSLLFEQGYCFLDDHLKRLKDMFELLYPGVSWDSYEKAFLRDLKKIQPKDDKSYFVRLTLFQDFDEKIHSTLSCREISESTRVPLSLKIAKHRRSPGSLPSFMKYGNYLETNIEKRKAKELGFDDILYLDNNQHLTEASTSNIFFRKGHQTKTPALNGCLLDGITRKNLIKALKGHGIDVEKGSFGLDELYEADEVWLTNSIRGIMPVNKIEDRVFKVDENKITKLNEMYLSQVKIGKVLL